MKKIVYIAVILFFAIQTVFAQKQKYDWKAMKPDERKQLIQKMSPEERMQTLQEFRENMLVEELNLPQNTQEEFKNLYSEYQNQQTEIKKQFKPSENYESMTDEEAKKQLDESFDVGQKLLNNRKAYCEKFMKIIKPQQVLQMYQTEGKMRNKILEKKQDGQRKYSPQRRRP